MGAAFSFLFEIIELAEELSLSTGFTVESILSGEAFAAASAEAAWLIENEIVDVQAVSALEALTLTGLSSEEFSLLSALPNAFSNAIGIGTFFQTVTGASAVVAAGISTFGYSKEVPVVSMALVPWFPEVDYLFPGLNSFSYFLNALLDWGESLIHAVSRDIWQQILRQTRLQITQTTTALATRGTYELQDRLARIIENARWALTSGPMHVYNSVESYYRDLPRLNPIQLRQRYRLLGEQPPDLAEFQRQDAEIRREIWGEGPRSGDYVEMHGAPGGAHQRVAQDWMLPLILGLYGDIEPAWGIQLRKEEDGPPKKKARVQTMHAKKACLPQTRSSTKTACQRRGRSSRS
ncbi:VP2 [Alphapolyomavirus septipanos]|uniref:Minor capsid protein n=1 Tax=Alphapolyomavirus septipanos TaxID=1891739 RepID=K7QJ81_9POLY|nr:VP2 [Alphapolyomavirus septipanos]AFU25593.1 VP2 [Alphapolyomavirus septipanos]